MNCTYDCDFARDSLLYVVMEHEEEKLFTLEEFLECLEVEEFSLRNC